MRNNFYEYWDRLSVKQKQEILENLKDNINAFNEFANNVFKFIDNKIEKSGNMEELPENIKSAIKSNVKNFVDFEQVAKVKEDLKFMGKKEMLHIVSILPKKEDLIKLNALVNAFSEMSKSQMETGTLQTIQDQVVNYQLQLMREELEVLYEIAIALLERMDEVFADDLEDNEVNIIN